jgi:hypothetical protein
VATVCFIPGILGSYLGWTAEYPLVRLMQLGLTIPPNPVPTILWPNPFYLLTSGQNYLMLGPDGQSDLYPHPLGPVEPVAPIGEAYAGLAGSVPEWAKFVWFGVDWRKDLRSEGNRIAGLIMGAKLDRPIYLVAHSQGGLVARCAYDSMKGKGFDWNVKRLVTMGTPHWGAMIACATLCSAGQVADWMLNFLNVNPLSSRESNQQAIRRMAQSWPGLREMLPSQQPGSPVIWNNQPDAPWTAAWYGNFATDTLLQSGLDAANNFQAGLTTDYADNFLVPVVGTRHATIVGWPDDLTQRADSKAWKYDWGDGMVMPLSARFKSSVPYVDLGADHTSLPNDPIVQNHLQEWCEQGLSKDVHYLLPEPPEGPPPNPWMVPQTMFNAAFIATVDP